MSAVGAAARCGSCPGPGVLREQWGPSIVRGITYCACAVWHNMKSLL